MKSYSIKSREDRKSHITGFTLIEVMIVIAIMGILTSIGVPNFRKYSEEAGIQVAITEKRFIKKEIIKIIGDSTNKVGTGQ